MLYYFCKNNEVLIKNTKLSDLLHLEMNHYSAEATDDFEIKTSKDKKNPGMCPIFVLWFVDINLNRC